MQLAQKSVNMVSASPKASARGGIQLAQKPVNVVSTSPKASARGVMQLAQKPLKVVSASPKQCKWYHATSPNASERGVS